jgi:hypothetical protein
MGKRIYITEEIADKLYQYDIAPIKDLPSDIKNVLKNHKTSLGQHPSFPPEEEISFDLMIAIKRFEEVRQKALDLNLETYSIKSIEKKLQDIIDKCKEIESNFKTTLENICYNYVIDLFQVPNGLVAFDCKLVDKVNSDKAQIKNKETIDFDNIKQRTRLHDAVYKRRLINAIITGGASRLSQINKQLIGELYELSPELPLLYKQIQTLNEYLLFTKNNMGMSEKNKKQSGISILTIGNETTKNKIMVEGEIFPILLHESIRGFLEMFAAYGLPSSKKECTYVMSKADFLDAEPWDMRLGPLLWDYLTSVFKYPKSQELPMILTILFSQTTEKFNSIMQEIFGETKRSKEIAQKILTKAYNEIESDEFDELMAKKQTNTTIISDEYFLPEDL